MLARGAARSVAGKLCMDTLQVDSLSLWKRACDKTDYQWRLRWEQDTFQGLSFLDVSMAALASQMLKALERVDPEILLEPLRHSSRVSSLWAQALWLPRKSLGHSEKTAQGRRELELWAQRPHRTAICRRPCVFIITS